MPGSTTSPTSPSSAGSCTWNRRERASRRTRTGDRFVAFALKALTTERWKAWVARDRTGPVGAMWLHAIERIPVPGKAAGPIGYLTNVYVAPQHRNGGLGSRMLDHVLAWARAERYSCVLTWPTPRSRPFYRRAGFDRLDEPFMIELEPDEPR